MDELQIDELTYNNIIERKSKQKSKKLCIMTTINWVLGVIQCTLGIISLVASGYIYYEDSEMILKTLFNNYYVYISLGLGLIILINEIVIFINIVKKPKITYKQKYITVGLFITLITNIIMLLVHVGLYVLS